MTSVAARLATGSVFAALVGCGTNHDLLAQKPDPGSDGALGDGANGADSFPVVGRDSSTRFDAGDPEPPGPWSLTLLNGVVDVALVRFCFVPVVGGNEVPPDQAPFPAPGLSFGARLALSALDGIDLGTTDVHPYLVVGSPAGSAPFSCRQVPRSPSANVDASADSGGDAGRPGDTDAGSPNASAYVSLPLIPAGTLGEARSYLAVATGCSRPIAPPAKDGGDGGDVDAGDAEAGASGETAIDTGACGTGFGPITLGLSLVRLSRRTNFSKLGFQTVNASNAASPASLLVEQANTMTSVYITDALALGQITPRAQPTFVTKSDLGIVPAAAFLRVMAPVGSAPFPEFRSDLQAVLTANQLTAADLVEATNFTFVLLGAKPGRVLGPGEQPFRIGLVENAPKGSDAD